MNVAIPNGRADDNGVVEVQARRESVHDLLVSLKPTRAVWLNRGICPKN